MLMRIYKYLILTGLLFMFFLPTFQKRWNLYEGAGERKLEGHFEEAPPPPTLTRETWFTGSFQRDQEDWMKQSFGFRNSLVRLHNQIDFELFNKVNAVDIYSGKDGFLFRLSEEHGIKGEDFVGRDEADDKVEKLRYIQDEFEKRGTHMFVAIAPGKVYYHKDKIPDWRMDHIGDHTNYSYYKAQFEEHGVNCFDMNEWFLQMRDTAEIPLYSKLGIHWTMYGSFVAADSLLGYMESMDSIDIPGIYWDTLMAVEKPWIPETDIYNAMNLLFPMDEFQMYHPKLRFEDPAGKTRPNVIVIGDSYWHSPLWNKIPQMSFSERSSYWYYFKNKETNDFQHLGEIKPEMLPGEYADQDYVILLFTATNLNRFAYGFIDDTYEMFKQQE